jgi:triacylglycerol lipase
MKIVLVHGLFDTGNIFRYLRGKLTAEGHECFCPDLKPANARTGIVNLAEKLQSYIDDTIPDQEPIGLIGFSMGCLVSRHYLQELAHGRTIKAFISISGPHAGSLAAYFYFGKGARDLRPNSEFLKGLLANPSCLADLQILKTYRTPYDLMILPSTSSELAQAQNKVVKALSHRWMLCNRQVCDDILFELRNQ